MIVAVDLNSAIIRVMFNLPISLFTNQEESYTIGNINVVPSEAKRDDRSTRNEFPPNIVCWM